MKITKKRLQEIVLEEMRTLKEYQTESGGVDPESVKGLSGGSAVASRLGSSTVQGALDALKQALERTPPQRKAEVISGIVAQLTNLQGDQASASRMATALRNKASEKPVSSEEGG